MMRLLCFVFAITVVAAGCSDKDRVPGKVIAKEKMEKILWDIVQAERFSASFIAKDSTKNIKQENFKMYEQIFKLHKVTKEEFVKSYQFYLRRPDISKVMFDSLATHANRSREELYNKPEKIDSAKPRMADTVKPRLIDAVKRRKLDSAKVKIRPVQ